MKEKLYTIPMNDAINAGDECPFCYVRRSLEQDALDLVLGSGSSYMESDMRELTDKAGFCQAHFKKMFDYGNTLGNAWILKTHYRKMRSELEKAISSYRPGKTGFTGKILKKSSTTSNSIAAWVAEKEDSCYICRHNQEIFDRYLDTFFILYSREEDFRSRIRNSKGFCLSHFGVLCQAAETKLKEKERADFFAMLFPLMQENMDRLQEDVDWMVEKFDYKNHDKDWRNSKDAIQRGMQKLKGGYPADAPYRSAK